MSRGSRPDRVPLFLIPKMVADEIGQHGRAVREIHIIRTRCHFYTVTTVTTQKGAGHE